MEEIYVKSLEEDPTPNPFAFTYDPTERMQKKHRDEEGGEGEFEGEGTVPTMATVDAFEVARATVQVGLEQLKEFLNDYHKTLVTDVANKVTSILLERFPNEIDDYYNEGGYEEFKGLDDEGGGNNKAVVPKTTNDDVAAEVPTAGDVVNEEHSLFSLGIDNAIVQAHVVEALAAEAAKMMPPPPPKAPQVQVDAPTSVQVSACDST